MNPNGDSFEERECEPFHLTWSSSFIYELLICNALFHQHHQPNHPHLGGIIHDLIRELRLGNVLPQLLDPGAPSLRRAVLVDHLVG